MAPERVAIALEAAQDGRPLRLTVGRHTPTPIEFAMLISANCVAYIRYTLTNDAGTVLDSSEGGEPLAYLHGGGNIIPGLEKALEGKQAGDKLTVKVEPQEGYGVRDESLVQKIPRRAFQGVKDLRPGMRFNANSGGGGAQVVVTHVQGDMVTIDGNHALAGVTLTFAVEIEKVREATAEELMHGHVHGAGGHHH